MVSRQVILGMLGGVINGVLDMGRIDVISGSLSEVQLVTQMRLFLGRGGGVRKNMAAKHMAKLKRRHQCGRKSKNYSVEV